MIKTLVVVVALANVAAITAGLLVTRNVAVAVFGAVISTALLAVVAGLPAEVDDDLEI
jgi:hypothetical protein